MVFRRDNKPEFQRQMGALRQQLGTHEEGNVAPESTYVDQREMNYAPVQREAPPVRETSSYPLGSYAPAPVATTPEPAAAPAADAQTSVIAQETIWKGDLESRGSIHIHGRVEGTVTAAREIYVAEGADVDASLTAAVIIVAGAVSGEIRCTNRFEMLPSGRVDGNVQAPSLVVHEGASITGGFKMGSPEVSNDSKVASVMGRRAARGTA
jgi:cytoskeletal protein CcmA (bactofilin family)